MLTTNAKERKETPLTTGVLDYFPDALAEVARVSKAGNDQHNPGQPLHWAKDKSTDHADCIARHLLDRGKLDVDGMRHSAKLAWRALAQLQIEIEEEKKAQAPYGGGLVTEGTTYGPSLGGGYTFTPGANIPLTANQLDYLIQIGSLPDATGNSEPVDR